MITHYHLFLLHQPGDLTVSKRTGTSNRIEIHFRTFNHLSRPDSFVKLFETLCLCLAQGNEYLGQIWDRNLIPLMRYWVILNLDFYFTNGNGYYFTISARLFPSSEITWKVHDDAGLQIYFFYLEDKCPARTKIGRTFINFSQTIDKVKFFISISFWQLAMYFGWLC
jgi:hypothetical protein